MTLIGFWFIVFNTTFNNISVIGVIAWPLKTIVTHIILLFTCNLVYYLVSCWRQYTSRNRYNQFILFHNKPIFFYRFDFGIITSDMKVKPAITDIVTLLIKTIKSVFKVFTHIVTLLILKTIKSVFKVFIHIVILQLVLLDSLF
jgi:hypothetical protein